MFAITAEFRIKPDRIDDFKTLIEGQATRSVAEERGCRQFDVCQHHDKPEVFVLYEVYANAAAFDEEHLKIPRFAEFLEKAKPMMAADPVITRLNRLFANSRHGMAG